MIRIYDFKNNLLDEGDTSAKGSVPSKSTIVIYVNYIKGDEINLILTFDVYEKRLDDWYPMQYEDTPETVKNYKKVFSKSGKYRIMIPIAENEELLRVNCKFSGGTINSPGDAKITLIPMAVGY